MSSNHTSTPAPCDGNDAAHGKTGFAVVLGAIGVVFGDIGTSPLYTLKEAFSPHYGLTPDHDTVLGILSLVFWALMIVVTLKYVAIIMRADNDGEGGIMALTALAQRTLPGGSRSVYVVGILGIFGASLFFGDGVITPAISVLSAVEGLEVAAPRLHSFVVPITVMVLVMLFVAQRFGTERVGKAFGPITVLWFLALGAIGVYNLTKAPEVLHALNPWWGVRFFAEHNWHAVFVLGAVVLAVTGGEALYADMGHFGAKAIRYSWNFLVLPMLTLTYLGQGALMLRDPAAVRNPFYESVPEWGLYPMIVLATAATVIASQAVITGAYSVASQAIQLGYIPRMHIRHTSHSTIGQIYIPGVNWMLLALVIMAVLGFGNSTALATAYGVSVTGTMLITTVLMVIYARANPRVPRVLLWMMAVVFVAVDCAFFYANIIKFMDGAWFPLLLGLILFTLMRTWRRGRKLLQGEIRKDGIKLDTFLPGLMLAPPVRVPGTAVFLTADPLVVPHALMHNLKHNKVLHERNVFLTVETLPVPYATAKQRLKMDAIGDEFYRVIVRFGFMETPDVPLALMRSCDQGGIYFDPMDTTYFASRETIVASANRGMPIWRDKLFAVMHRNAAPATGFFRIPGNRLVELGAQVEI
ncbi:potassium transporter Kup [Xanthomonas translucens pv. arrhenatheri]|jgi:KUP system potassium uptake protein|uniref:Probable potassium transport system protein Kup n=2 Tax=Xanthomonas graminis TaxID=3390026 RepID=A0A0K2ZDK2_9XANT|nr:potassium transporter Kup [Xanthomonas translucens]OAX57720.1 potassium transporter Kup [Xanthomonas translucens pv. poae]OAX64286.1 potassium transporter Kup [Xanthomonas translucens pv. arrhenatheri]UKE74354.1 potassium transporter Kup [Xanthomonas translucens pv. phleipratensis]UKE76596.1 potassium transporter Kup [Xanthomonas translucens pv. arrhenatheri]CTP82254.1 putative potassium transport system protein kup [Xanthomonas translucens pv. arrhenatheri LMG 727]